MKTFIVLSSSFPVSLHWCVSKECNLPHGELHNITLQQYNSSLMVNHTFNGTGNYCVNIGVMNDVSATNTSFMVKIPGKANNNIILFCVRTLYLIFMQSHWALSTPTHPLCQSFVRVKWWDGSMDNYWNGQQNFFQKRVTYHWQLMNTTN